MEMNSLEKLYENDSYIKNFKANIVDVKSDEDGSVLLVLDRTIFYPEGGGQPSDTGIIGNCRISHVFKKDKVIYHRADKKPDTLNDVDCRIDWERRFDFMQQHCGQHILSAAFGNLYGCNTIGFHLGEKYVTIDIDIQSLSEDDAKRAENVSNDIVFQNLPVTCHYPSKDELSKYKLRKQPTVEDNIRIVEIEGFDFCPCGGTHPSRTGDVGLIKIRKWEKYKNSVRVEFVCGNRALKDYQWKNDFINKASNILSSKDEDVLENISKMSIELCSLKKETKSLKDTVLSYESSDLYSKGEDVGGVRIVKKLFEDKDFKDIISLSGKIANHDNAVALLGLKSDSARMVFSRSHDININIGELFKEVLPIIGGKGGGGKFSAQGGGPDVSNLESALDAAYVILKNRYLK